MIVHKTIDSIGFREVYKSHGKIYRQSERKTNDENSETILPNH